MTEPYVPQVGHRVRCTFEGVVRAKVGPGAWVKTFEDASLFGGAAATWTRLADPEPEWQPGDIVIDADDDVYVRVTDQEYPWYQAHETFMDAVPTRPLTRLVRETRAMTISEAAGVNDATHGHEGSAMTGNPCPEPIPAPAAQTSRSESGGWSGVWRPQEGDYVRPKPGGNAHIVLAVYSLLFSDGALVDMVCGKRWTTHALIPASGDPVGPCSRCWDQM